MNSDQNRNGFTIVEIMIVVAIIGLLASLAIPSFIKSRNESQRTACANSLRLMAGAKDIAALENNWSDSDSAATIGNPLYMDTISAYLKGGERPKCPTGANCYYNGIDQPPTCQSGIDTHIFLPANE